MHKTIGWLAGALTALTLVGPAIAGDAMTSPSTTPAESPKAAAPKTTGTRHLTGEIVSVDQSAKTITVKHGRKAKELTLAVEDAAAGTLADLKPGEHVRIGYVDDHGRMTAKSITGHDRTAKH